VLHGVAMPNIEEISIEQFVNLKNVQLPGAPAKREEVWVSPLEVFFSQNVIYPLFSDGRSVDDAVREITAVEVPNSEEGRLMLQAPFETTEAVRWCPKLRDGQGKPLLDADGEERKGAEGLFSLDNRRLYALQRAAVAHHPRHCFVKVKVVSERFEVARHLKKFRTRTNGSSISITEWNGTGRDNARDFNVLRVWDWRSAVAKVEGPGSGTAAVEAADSGNIGCWEYLDARQTRQGPFSNFQMRQWWEMKMLPPSIRVRPYFADRGSNGRASEEDYRLAVEVFADAPAPFAPGWSPRAKTIDGDFQVCAECGRQRLEGRSARGQWYCSTCWRKWESR